MSEQRDPDDGLTPYERTRRALHRAIDRICDLWPQALDDANARGYPTGHDWNDTNTGGSSIVVDGERVPATNVECVALQPSHAVAWLAELHDTYAELWLMFGPNVPRLWEPEFIRRGAHLRAERLCHTWPASAEHVTRRIIRLANQACQWWPPPEQPNKPGKRTADLEECVVCQIVAVPGDRRAVKTPDGQVEGYAHKSPCWYQLTVSRSKA